MENSMEEGLWEDHEWVGNTSGLTWGGWIRTGTSGVELLKRSKPDATCAIEKEEKKNSDEWKNYLWKS